MKKQFLSYLFRYSIRMVLAIGLLPFQKAEAQTNYNGISFQVFYDELAPYGDWVSDARYGYIWLPAVSRDFHPYGTDGHWIMTEYGNTWVSYYDWGWAPFHYGRWTFDNFYRAWAWIPDYEWGPAWVNWRTGSGYYGWAPLGPGFSLNVQINIPSFYWTFVPQNRLTYTNVHRYHIRNRSKMRIYNNTTIINNTVVYNNYTYIGGPQRREIERATRTVVPVYSVNNSTRPGRTAINQNAVELYRPNLQTNRDRGQEARPSRILNAEEAQTSRAQQRGKTNVLPSNPNNTDRSRTGNSPGTEERVQQSQPIPTQRGEAQTQNPVTNPSRNEGVRTQSVPNQVRSSGSENNSAPTRTAPAVRNQDTQTVRPSSGDRGTSNTRVAQPTRSNSSETKPATTPSRNTKRTTPTTGSQSTTPTRSGRGGGN
jgi:hypothetical protein